MTNNRLYVRSKSFIVPKYNRFSGTRKAGMIGVAAGAAAKTVRCLNRLLQRWLGLQSLSKHGH